MVGSQNVLKQSTTNIAKPIMLHDYPNRLYQMNKTSLVFQQQDLHSKKPDIMMQGNPNPFKTSMVSCKSGLSDGSSIKVPQPMRNGIQMQRPIGMTPYRPQSYYTPQIMEFQQILDQGEISPTPQGFQVQNDHVYQIQ